MHSTFLFHLSQRRDSSIRLSNEYTSPMYICTDDISRMETLIKLYTMKRKRVIESVNLQKTSTLLIIVSLYEKKLECETD